MSEAEQDEKDDILAAISEGILDIEAEYCPVLVLKPAGDKVHVIIDGELHRIVDAADVNKKPIHELMKPLGIPSSAVEVRPSDKAKRVGVLLPPHITCLPYRSLWRVGGKARDCYLVKRYLPTKGAIERTKFSWIDGVVTTHTSLMELRAWMKGVRKGRILPFKPDEKESEILITELTRHDAQRFANKG